jgi:hypothetical protein
VNNAINRYDADGGAWFKKRGILQGYFLYDDWRKAYEKEY